MNHLPTTDATMKNRGWDGQLHLDMFFWLKLPNQQFLDHKQLGGVLMDEQSVFMNGQIGEDENRERLIHYSGPFRDTDVSRAVMALLRKDFPHTSIEVKWGKAAANLIVGDITKLARIRESNAEISCCLIIGSQLKILARYMNKGTANN